MKGFLVLASVLVAIQAAAISDSAEQQWQHFKLKHNRNYESEAEHQYRKAIFLNNLQQIEEHNKNFEEGIVSYTLGVNQFADKTQEELISTLTGYQNSRYLEGVPFVPSLNGTAPKSFDWRENGAVTPVKNQQQCGSCWAFSATGSLEGQFFLKTNKLVSLSEQNLIDCSRSEGNMGCEGGMMDLAFRYVIHNGGIDTEESYPYKARDGQCNYNPQTSAAKASGYARILTDGSEEYLPKAVADVGPLSVAIDAKGLFFYKGGIYNNPKCSNESLNYAVLLVGYGTTDDGVDYWLVKNSWGDGFGEEGFVRMSRNKNNQCGIASHVTFPIVSN